MLDMAVHVLCERLELVWSECRRNILLLNSVSISHKSFMFDVVPAQCR